MIRINSQAIYKISKKLSNVNNFLYGWEQMNKSVKPCITNRLEKGGIPSAHQVLLKMILKAHVIDMPPPPPKGNVPRECRIFVTKLHGAGPKAAKFDIRETKIVVIVAILCVESMWFQYAKSVILQLVSFYKASTESM